MSSRFAEREPVDLDTVADELYGLRPEQFTAARNERAAAARSAGNRALADEIGRLRRPSLSAWASNTLVRARRDQVEPLVELGEALRQAHRDLDPAQLRDLVHQQRLLIGALTRQAAQLAADAGHPLGQDAQREVQDTLQAVLADPEAARQWASGRLTKPLTPSAAFPATSGEAPPRHAAKPDRAKRPARAGAEKSAEDQRRRRRLAEAREAAEEADRERAARAAEAEEAARRAQEVEERIAELKDRVETLSKELKDAEAELAQARSDDRTAREETRAAERRVRDADRAAQKAARRVEELSDAG
ncbi:hypothetical protein [Streptomyces sp. KAU_LT]|uniref:hypothetical protein n=1 Tax=Streptomyces sp. KAU_LT TaxID=3046669 RepID=UPI0024B67913|nr:hypothetical protein [Streptomyces sp. KAU_LT]MDI9832988.1 hypothetical protein [Streptomyces sp. KAU_LT]